MWIEVELEAFTATEYDEAVVGLAQEILHVAVTGVVAGGSRVGAGFAASRIGVGGGVRGRKTFFKREAQEIERGICEWNFGDADIARVWRLIDANGIPVNF